MTTSSQVGGRTAEPRSLLLDPAAVLDLVPRLLPRPTAAATHRVGQDKAAEATTGETIRNASDALAILLHAILTRLDFRLTSVGEGPSAVDVRPTSAAATIATAEAAAEANAPAPPNALPAQWNASGPSSYAFTYTHDQSSLHFLLKLVSLASRTIIHGTALEHDRTCSFEVETKQYTSTSFWPFPRRDAAATATAASHPEPLVNGYIATSRIQDLVLGFQANVVQKLVPGLRKEGYEEVPSEDAAASSGAAGPSSAGRTGDRQGPMRNYPPPPTPLRPPEGVGGGRPEPDRPPLGPLGVPPDLPQPGRSPFTIGDRDLDPLAGRSPLRLPGQGGAGFAPPPLFPDNGGGMFVGPDHPMFRDRFGPPQGGGGGVFGGDGYLPPGAVPPGARFDPVGPFGMGGPGGGFGRGGGGGGGAPRPPPGGGFGSGDPDWDDVRPPRGNNHDYFM